MTNFLANFQPTVSEKRAGNVSVLANVCCLIAVLLAVNFLGLSCFPTDGVFAEEVAAQADASASPPPRRVPLPPRIQDLSTTQRPPSTPSSPPSQPAVAPKPMPAPPADGMTGGTPPRPAPISPGIPSGARAATPPARLDPQEEKALTGPVDWVEIRLEADGKVGDMPGKTPSTALKIQARLAYEERIIQSGDGRDKPIRGLRAYQEAQSDFLMGEARFQASLRPERREIAFELAEGDCVLFSPKGPLTRDEVDLLDVIATSAWVDLLLPEFPVRNNQEWDIADDVLARLLRLDSVTSSQVKARVTEITGDTIRVELGGNLRGNVLGASAQIELLARYLVSNQERKITWLGLALRDSRTPGYVDGAFQGIVRLQMTRQTRTQPQLLSFREVNSLVFPPLPEQTQLLYQKESHGYRLVHDRKWYVVSESPDLLVLRYVDRHGLMGQCNLARITPAENVKLTITGFQENVRQTLGKNFGRFLDVNELESPSGHRMFRVHATGQTEGVTIHWIYYLLTSPQNASYAAVFTVDDASLPAFGEADREFMNGFHFLEPTRTASGGTGRVEAR